MGAAARNPHVLQGLGEKSNVLGKGLDIRILRNANTDKPPSNAAVSRLPAASRSFSKTFDFFADYHSERRFFRTSLRTVFFLNQSRTKQPRPSHLSDLRRVFFGFGRLPNLFCGKSAFSEWRIHGNFKPFARRELLSCRSRCLPTFRRERFFAEAGGGGSFSEFAKNRNGSAAGRRFPLHAPVGARRSRAPKAGRLLQGASYCPMSLESASE